jgi:class 3 adenylate cyclase
MPHRYVRRFSDPDEVISVGHVRSEQVAIGGLTIGRDLHEPGWRWSTHIEPLVGTEWCQAHHLGIVLSGHLGIHMVDGTEFQVGPMEVMDVPPGHDGWVIGDEPVETITWSGVKAWLAVHDTMAERVLATIVFTDIVGSTAAAERLGARAWADTMARLEAQGRDEVSRFRGRLVKKTGDGLLATFDGAARALRCALSLREAAASLELALRVAVHTGEVAVSDDDIQGLAVHEASRMLALAEANEIIVSASTAGLAAGGDFTFADRGEHELRGIDGVRRLYALA